MNPKPAFNTQLTSIRDHFAALRRDNRARHRDIAEQLGITEGELIAAHVEATDPRGPGTMSAQRLRADWPQIIEALEPVGEVMALTRNASCVHENVGRYQHSSHTGPMGLVLGGEIDLRLFYSRWVHGFAVDDSSGAQRQRSLQFFDAAGVAIHKVFLRPNSHEPAWDALRAAFSDNDQAPGIAVRPADRAPDDRPDTLIDTAAFRQAWASMRDTHEFFGLLKQHGVSRTQALRLADPQFAQRVEPEALQSLLNGAAGGGVPIMVFVGNPGIIQIHSGPVHRIEAMGPWLNVLDEGFNLHLRADHIAQAWVVGKPTSDGLVSSLELFDARGDTIAMLFGERKPGRPERADWRALLDAVVQEAAPCAA